MSESNFPTERDDPKLRQILDSAADLPAEQRQAFLDQACGGDGNLRVQVESLLLALDQAEGREAEVLVDGKSCARDEVQHEFEQRGLGCAFGHVVSSQRVPKA